MFRIVVFWGVVVLCAASLDVENELKEMRAILTQQESVNQELRNENRVLRAEVRKITTEIEKLKKNDFSMTATGHKLSEIPNERFKKIYTNEFLKSKILNTGEIKPSKIEHLRTTGITSQPVAFYAYITNNLSNPRDGQAIIFGQVQTNVGGGYNGFSGVFTAQSDGIYIFTWTIYSAGHGQTKFHIFVNNNVLGYTFSDTSGTGNYDSDSGSMVVQLKANDTVYIKSAMNCSTRVISNSDTGISTFAGGKISELYM